MLSFTPASLRTGIVRVALIAVLLIASLAVGTSSASAHYGHHWSGHENQSWHGWHTWWWSHGHGQCTHTPTPIAAFTATPDSTFVGDEVAFDASATSGGVVKDWHGDDVVGVVKKYDWSFGDGSTATSEFPTTTHTYADAGTYPVKLTVTNDADKTSTITKNVSVSSLPVPTASFTHDPQAPLATQAVGFDASSSTGGESNGRVGTIVSYSWDFGDGPTVSPAEAGADPTTSHTFADAGTFVVTLTVTNDAGKTATATESLEVAPLPKPKPTASFTLTPSSPVAEREVVWDGSASTGGSTPYAVGTIVSYDWNFGDGHTTSSDTPTTNHTFAFEGTFVVSLTVTNDAGESNTASQSVVVAPVPPPYDPGDGPADFSADGATPYAVSPLAPQSLVSSSKSGRGVNVGFAVSFALPAGVDSASACDGSAKVAVSSAGQRKVSGNASLATSDEGCQLRFKLHLPKGYAGKKAKFAFAFSGNDAIAPWSLTRKLVVK
jgi:PKD repeat protein